MIRPERSKKRHGQISLDSGAPVNAALYASLSELRPLLWPGLEVRLAFIHIGPGYFGQGSAAPLHIHPDIQIEQVLSGEVVFSDESRSWTLGRGRALTLPAGHLHGWRCLQPAVMIGADVAVSGVAAEAFLRELREGGALATADLSRAGSMLIAACREPSGGTLYRAECLLALHAWFLAWVRSMPALMALDARACHMASGTSDERGAAMAERARQYMHANCSAVTVRSAAAHVALSVRQLTRIMLRHAGMTPGRCLRRIRLDHAQSMLAAHPEWPVKQVARLAGFSSAAHLAFVMRKNGGTSPRRGRSGG